MLASTSSCLFFAINKSCLAFYSICFFLSTSRTYLNWSASSLTAFACFLFFISFTIAYCYCLSSFSLLISSITIILRRYSSRSSSKLSCFSDLILCIFIYSNSFFKRSDCSSICYSIIWTVLSLSSCFSRCQSLSSAFSFCLTQRLC